MLIKGNDKKLSLELTLIDKILYDFLNLLDMFSFAQFGKEITITCLFREFEENKPIHHCEWRAADIRTKNLTSDQIKILEKFCFMYRDNFDERIRIEPHESMKGTASQHLHVHVRRKDE